MKVSKTLKAILLQVLTKQSHSIWTYLIFQRNYSAFQGI